jgi:hypothetical protein
MSGGQGSGESLRLPPGRTWRVTVIGGVAMALGYGARRTTRDADVVDTRTRFSEQRARSHPSLAWRSTG